MKVLLRTAQLAGALVYLAFLGVSFVGQWMLDHPTRENLERGLRWDSQQPSLWARYARQWHFRARTPESHRAVEGYKKAASLNPFDPATWRELATVQMERGDLDGAEAALRAELAVIPNSPQASWRMANLLLVRGRTAEAYPYLITAAANDATLRHPVFDLAWKLEEDSDVIHKKLVPETPEARADYFRFLIIRKRLAEAYAVWKEIASAEPRRIVAGNSYAETLATAGMGHLAGRVWEELLALTGRASLRPAGELLTDGEFEGELANSGLGWRMNGAAGYQIALDSFVVQRGSQSLRVVFDGSANLNFGGVWQFVPVEPNRRYRFEGFLKTDGITTDNGLFFHVATQGAPREEAFSIATPNRVETAGWVREQLDFQTGPRTSVVVVQLRRSPSQKLNNLLQGKVWIDSVSLRPRDP